MRTPFRRDEDSLRSNLVVSDAHSLDQGELLLLGVLG